MSAAVAAVRLPKPFDALPWPPRIDWRRGAVAGMAMGILPMLLEQRVAAATSMLGPLIATIYFSVNFLSSAGRGAVMAWTAQWVEGRLVWSVTAALFAIECLLLAVVQVPIERLFNELWFNYPLNAKAAMVLWINLTYGGVFFAYCLATQRALRVRGVLARAELARQRSATALDEARLDAMAARVDPTLLLRVLSAARQAYERRHEGADALLDALVTFLRLAMPAVRSGKSTLRAELALLRAHAALQALLEPGRCLCTLSVEMPPGDVDFPPLLLIPLVEAAAARGRRPPQVSLLVREASLVLSLDASTAAGWLDDTTTQRLERALRGLHDSPEARFEVGASPSLTLWLPLPTNPEEIPHEFATV